MTTTTQHEICEPIERIKLSEFCNALQNGDYTELSQYAPAPPTDYPVFSGMASPGRLTGVMQNETYNSVFVKGLVYYLEQTKYEDANLNRILATLCTLRYEVVIVNILLSFYIASGESSAANGILQLTGIDITAAGVEEAARRIKYQHCIPRVKEYIAAAGQLFLYQPRHNKNYFLSIIEQVNNEHSFYPGKTPEQVYQDLTLFEFIQYYNSTQVKAD